MSTTQVNIQLYGEVQNLATVANIAAGNPANISLDQSGAVLIAPRGGKYATAAYRGIINHLVQTVTIPHIASNLVSTFTVLNPTGSGKNLELIDCDILLPSGTGVIDVLGLYYQSSPAALSTATTTTVINGLIGAGVASVATAYSAGTFTGTPSLLCPMFQDTSTSPVVFGPMHFDFDGKFLVPPNCAITIAADTGAFTAGAKIRLAWAETLI